MRRPFRIALTVIAVALVVIVAAVGIAVWQFDPNSFKPQIEAAVKRATGRDLALNGRIGLALSLTPTIQVRDATFSNPPGFSRPAMATLQSMELRLALLPLLSRRVDIQQLVLNHPDILLETNAHGEQTNAHGEPNWKLTPEVSPQAPAGSHAAPSTATRSKTTVSIASVRIQDGTVAYRDDRTNRTTTLGLPSLDAKAASADAPMHIEATASYDGHPFTLNADTGSLTRLQEPDATTPWPLKLILAAAGAQLTADGTLTRPLEGKGYTLSINGNVPDAAALAPYLQGVTPPPLHDVSFAAKVADKGAALPDVTALIVHIGASDLGPRFPGLMLEKADIDAPAIDQPVKANATGTLSGAPMAFAGTFGPLAAFLPGTPPAPFPIDVKLQAASASAAAKGTVADVHQLAGVNLTVAANIPDLSALTPLAQHSLPPLKSIAFGGNLNDTNGSIANGVALRGIALNTADGDLSGDMTVGLRPRVSVVTALKSNRIDADALQAAIDQTRSQPAPAGQPGAPPAQPAPPPKPRDRRLFSDRPLHLELLRTADADITLNVGDLRSGGADYRALATHAVLKEGNLSVNPLSADLPAGHLQATFTADASKPAPPVHLTVRAPGLALRTVLTLLHEPSYASGNLEVNANLTGAGDSAHAIAGSMDGTLGLAMAGGTIDNRLLGSVLGKVMDSLNALNLVGKGGTSELRCFAVRMDARNGAGRIDPLVLSSSLLTMTGAGSVNLGAETLALQLRPQARVAGTGLVIPIDVNGPIRDPKVDVNRLGAAESNAGTVAGAVVGNATPLGIVGGLLGADKLVGGSGDICAPALAAARGQAAPQAVRPTQPKSNPARPNPVQTLQNLFR